MFYVLIDILLVKILVDSLLRLDCIPGGRRGAKLLFGKLQPC